VPESHSGREYTQHAEHDELEPVQYPTNHVVAIVDTPDQATCAIDALVHGGFLTSEVELACGPEEAERMRISTGRSGLRDLIIRVAQRLGMTHDELEVKDAYERALRDGHSLVLVLAPTEERKDRAAQIIRDCGGHFINFLGHLSRELIVP
jgi:hypothetical protein